MGRTQVEHRRELLGRITKAYRKTLALEKKLTNPSSEQKRKEWEFQLRELRKALQAAFDDLPEVRLSKVDMTAAEFAKELVKKKPNPKFLKHQTEAF